MGKDDDKKPKNPEAQEAARQTPQEGTKPAEDTAKAKHKGGREAELAKRKAGRAGLLNEIQGNIPNNSKFKLEFNDDDKTKLANAFKDPNIHTKLASLSTSQLEAAENTEHGTGARLFAYLQKEENGKQILKQTPYNYKFKQGDKLTINFKNQDQDDNYGMRTLFKHQPEIREVNIIQKGSRGAGREGIAKRSSLDGDFYFADGSYAPIFKNTEIGIIKVFTAAELEEYKKKPPEPIPTPPQPTPTPPAATAELIEPTPEPINHDELPENETLANFHLQFREIMQMSDPQKIIDMRDKIALRPNDPMVQIPGERKRIRSGAALRYALFKRYAQLKGYRVQVSSGYRSEQHQQRLWNDGLARRTQTMRERHPNASESEIRRKARSLNARFVAPPGRSHHNTGGAIDIKVYNPNGVKISGLKYRGSRRTHEEAMNGNFASFTGRYRQDNIRAIQALQELNNELKANYFLGSNYHREVWHWNVDNKDVYKKV